MAIATTYNHTHHNGGGNADGNGSILVYTSTVSQVSVPAHTGLGGRGPSLLVGEPDDYCGACQQCDDVCGKEGCTSCHDKMRLRCPSSPTCGGEPTFTMCQIRHHQTLDSAWLIADGYVYDATAYIAMHPGGEKSILKKCGGAVDCTQDLKFHSMKGRNIWKKYRIGKVRPCCQEGDKTWWKFWK